MFLSRKTEEIIKRNKDYIFSKNGLYNCKEPYQVGTMLPEKTRIVCDAHKCTSVLVNPNGFGEGREYVTNPPNKILDPLLKAEIDINNVCANSLDSLHYYPIQKNIYNKSDLRHAIPGLSLIHISEPTRPLYISYAVFCLKKGHGRKQGRGRTSGPGMGVWFFSSRRRHTRCREVSWARRCV